MANVSVHWTPHYLQRANWNYTWKLKHIERLDYFQVLCDDKVFSIQRNAISISFSPIWFLSTCFRNNFISFHTCSFVRYVDEHHMWKINSLNSTKQICGLTNMCENFFNGVFSLPFAIRLHFSYAEEKNATILCIGERRVLNMSSGTQKHDTSKH